MYYDYFGFRQPPFRITPDTSLFYPGGDRGAILEALLYAILNGEGIIKVVGEVGSGKTMLCRMLEKELPEKVEVVYLVNPSIAPENTLHAIAFELKLNVNSNTSRFEVMNALQQYLLQRHGENRQVVVFVEEAQSMPIATLEEIRLLSNLETQQSKLLQIVLFGQPELDSMIAQPEIRQLKERITYSFQLAPFRANDIREYINTRVRACGYRSSELFTDEAIREIEKHSKGLLRRVNILADKSLLAAFANNTHQVDVRHTRMAARDSEFLTRQPWPGKPLLIGGVAAALLVLIALFLLWQRPNLSGQADSRPASVAGNDPVPAAAEEAAAAITEPAQPKTGQSAILSPADNVTPVSAEPGIPSPDTSTPVTGDSGALDAEIEVSERLVKVEENSTIFEEVTLTINPAETMLDQPATAESQLLGMAAVYQLQDFGDSSLSAGETGQLQQQLLTLPPESAESWNADQESGICRRCWSIIYRPLSISKNL